MDSLPPTPFQVLMMQGHLARQKDSSPAGHRRAISFYDGALTHVNIADDLAEAYDAIGVSYRIIGEFSMAKSAFADARRFVVSRELSARILRDLGELHHDQAVKYRIDHSEASKLHFDDAKNLLKESACIFGALGNTVEEQASLGFYGMIMYELGQKSYAIQVLRETDVNLSNAKEPNFVYEFNNLIRRMRVSFFLDNVPLAWRGFRLARQGHGDWKRVIAAFFGNRFYRFAVERARSK